mmetsp:Transcript_9146/g.15678  ORF Transcript_9146/g.15678 Transcript_9146/m.15678 type:complete len:226 (+) Transcript_9146:1307-1984(+)
MFTDPVLFASYDVEDPSLVALQTSGIIVSPAPGVVQFSCPAAMRYVAKALFPNRSTKPPPATLKALVSAAISHMSASALRAAGVVGQNEQEAAKEALFQHNILAGLYAETPTSCAILTELSRAFRGNRIKGEVDYFVNGTLSWGLELMVHGRGRKKHVDRFSPDGIYGPLGCRDYLVVDFKLGEKSLHSRAFEAEKLMTVYFKMDYSSCDIYVNGVYEGIVYLRP